MENKKRNYIVLTIGVIVLILGIIMLVLSIKGYKQVQVEYDEWNTNWWVNHTATLNDQPSTAGALTFLFGSIFVCIVGLILSGVGLAVAFGKETADILEQNAEKASSIFDNLKDFGKPKNKVCNYCGSTNKPDATKCSSCGASISDKK